MSSRKYDRNVAPTDLEKIRRAHGACVVFFLKKNKSLFTQLLLLNNKTNKRIKSIFQLVFYFISCYYYYNKAINTVFYFNCLLFTITFIWKVSFILSLLAGKSEQICTAFPLQNITRFFFKTFSCSKNSKSFLTNLSALKNTHHLAFLNFSRENLLAEKLVGSFFTREINMNKIMKRINERFCQCVIPQFEITTQHYKHEENR